MLVLPRIRDVQRAKAQGKLRLPSLPSAKSGEVQITRNHPTTANLAAAQGKYH